MTGEPIAPGEAIDKESVTQAPTTWSILLPAAFRVTVLALAITKV